MKMKNLLFMRELWAKYKRTKYIRAKKSRRIAEKCGGFGILQELFFKVILYFIIENL